MIQQRRTLRITKVVFCADHLGRQLRALMKGASNLPFSSPNNVGHYGSPRTLRITKVVFCADYLGRQLRALIKGASNLPFSSPNNAGHYGSPRTLRITKVVFCADHLGRQLRALIKGASNLPFSSPNNAGHYGSPRTLRITKVVFCADHLGRQLRALIKGASNLPFSSPNNVGHYGSPRTLRITKVVFCADHLGRQPRALIKGASNLPFSSPNNVGHYGSPRFSSTKGPDYGGRGIEKESTSPPFRWQFQNWHNIINNRIERQEIDPQAASGVRVECRETAPLSPSRQLAGRYERRLLSSDIEPRSRLEMGMSGVRQLLTATLISIQQHGQEELILTSKTEFRPGPFGQSCFVRASLSTSELLNIDNTQRCGYRYSGGSTSFTLLGKVVSYSAPTEAAPRRVSFRPPPVSLPPPEQTRDRDSHESTRATRRRRASTQLTSLSASPLRHPTVKWPRPRTRRPPAPSLSVLFYFVIFYFSPSPTVLLQPKHRPGHRSTPSGHPGLRFPADEGWSSTSSSCVLLYNFFVLELFKKGTSVVIRLLASHLGDPGSIPREVSPRFSNVGIMADYAAGRRVFSGISQFSHPCIPELLRTHLTSPLSVLKTSMFRATQISSLSLSLISYFRFSPEYSQSKFNQKKWRGGEIPEKARRPAESSGTIPTCENLGVAWPEIEPGFGAAVGKWLAHSPPQQGGLGSILGGVTPPPPYHHPIFLMWESCRTMSLVGRFSQGSPVFPHPCIPAHLHTHLASSSSAVKSSPKSIHSLTHWIRFCIRPPQS
ncbi:hypothetical protein PR048_016795 [Dryococelus australis]|uniref:Uncharacterized protein n=1 Tax=Dryococelus australis TaxID=614101 RepID=A0ABQ9H892_9NEOP|nr:hypothetical protein PR048_016795 [Dryococelus australis]